MIGSCGSQRVDDCRFDTKTVDNILVSLKMGSTALNPCLISQ